jgi:sRNA-binding protein
VRTHPVLERLAALYPQLFGAVFLPLKRGIFQDLMAAHPDAFDKAELKLALGIHTRSSRYLQAVASGAPRHDLQGQPVEAMAPEHVHHALTEVFRRRQLRATEDLSPQLRQRIARAFEASGLNADAYTERVRSRDEAANALVAAAVQDATASMAKDEALLRAQEASGQALPEFAAAHGMDPRTAQQAIARAQRRAAAVLAAQAAAAAAPVQAQSDDDTETATELAAEEAPHTDAASDAAPATSAEPPLA